MGLWPCVRLTGMSRPLRHYYNDESVPLEVDASLGPVLDPWVRHRERFVDELSSLTDQQWRAESRCDGWSTRDVVCHLLDVDTFWMLSLNAGRDGAPTAYLRDFDPKATPLDLVDAKANLTTAEVNEQFAANTAAFIDTAKSFTDDEWSTISESPMGHVPARLTLAHALWDSWLHERDVLVPLGQEPQSAADELAVVMWYSLFFGATQGGLIGDSQPVGEGADAPIDAELRFDEVPDNPVRVRVDRGVRLERAGQPTPAGSALDFVEALTGRTEWPVTNGTELPTDLTAHLARARQVL